MYYAMFRTGGLVGKGKKAHFGNQFYQLDAGSYHEALYKFAPIQNWLAIQTDNAWRLDGISETPYRLADVHEEMPALGEAFQNLYYEAKHDYQIQAIEGTRLLNIRDDGQSAGYGAYIRMMDTGETCYACMNGKFFGHDEIEERVAKLITPYYDPRAIFPWQPVLFPWIKKDGQRLVDMTYYLMSDFRLAFPLQMMHPESFDAQIQWIMEREGLNE